MAGFGSVGFAELRDLIEAVPTEQKNRWADEIAAMPAGPQKRLAAIGLYATWIQLDPAGACASLATFRDRLLRAGIIDSVASAAPAAALPILAEMVSHLTPSEREVLLPTILGDWSSIDPGAAAQFFARNPNTVTLKDVVRLLSEWADEDLAAAREWLEKEPTFSNDPEAVAALVQKWLGTDSPAAIEYVRTHAKSPAFSNSVALIAPELFRSSPEGANIFIQSLPKDAQSETVAAILAGDYDHPLAEEMVRWAAGFPAEAWRGSLGPALASWTTTDEGEAIRWIRQQPETTREQLVQELSTTGGELTHALASLALSLSDETSRTQALRSFLAPWSDNPEELRRAVTALRLSPQQTSSLLKIGSAPR